MGVVRQRLRRAGPHPGGGQAVEIVIGKGFRQGARAGHVGTFRQVAQHVPGVTEILAFLAQHRLAADEPMRPVLASNPRAVVTAPAPSFSPATLPRASWG